MASFQAKIGLKRLRKRENKNYRAKIEWKRPRKRENKNYRFVSSLPEP